MHINFGNEEKEYDLFVDNEKVLGSFLSRKGLTTFFPELGHHGYNFYGVLDDIAMFFGGSAPKIEVEDLQECYNNKLERYFSSTKWHAKLSWES